VALTAYPKSYWKDFDRSGAHGHGGDR